MFTAETPGSDAPAPSGVAGSATTHQISVAKADAAPQAPAAAAAAPATEGAFQSASLAAIVVQPRCIRRVKRSRGTAHVLPVYRLLDAATGESYEFAEVLAGGEEDDPHGVCVALYRCSAAPHGVLVVKTLGYDDNTGEAAKVHAVACAGAAVAGCMVPARVAQRAEVPAPGEAYGPEHYTVVLMAHGGRPLTRLAQGGDRELLLAALRAVHAAAARLLRAGLAYVDLKMANALYLRNADGAGVTVVLCDYGGLAPLGSPDAVATYPPPQHPRGVRVAASAGTVMHGMGALLVSCFYEDLEPTLRYVKPNRKRLRDVAPVTDAGAAKLLREARDEALAEVEARDEALGKALRCAWDPRSTMADLGRALQLAAEDEA